MYETRLSRMTMQLPLAQMANRDGDAGMETMLWDINIIPNEQDNGYLMLPPRVLHMSALGRFGRFTLFSPRVSHSKHLPCSFCFVLCFGFGVFVALLCFCFLFCKCFGIPNSLRSLDLDDRQGLIASSALQQKKTRISFCIPGCKLRVLTSQWTDLWQMHLEVSNAAECEALRWTHVCLLRLTIQCPFLLLNRPVWIRCRST